MGCELCSNENRKNQEATLARADNKPEIINSFNKDTYFSALEERLNEKFSIQQKSTIEVNKIKNNNTSNNNENKNIFNYTQNIVNNNIIQYSSRNPHENESKIISSIKKEKVDFASLEFNSIFNKDDTNIIKLSDNSNLNNINDKNIKNKRSNHKHRHHHKHKHTHSSKDEEDKNKKIKHKNNVKEKSSKDENSKESNNDEKDDKDNNNINCLDPKQIKEKIKSLLKTINHSKVDQIIESAPLRHETTLEKLIKYFQKKSKKLSEIEKAWLIYKWITINIEYDFAGVNDKYYDVSEEATFKRGKSICAGYANLFKKICDNLDLIVEIIGGYSKGFNYEITDKCEESESHAWNAIKIEGDWYFIETTWGAGYSEDHKNFIKRFTSYYFFTPPIQFVRGHFPNDSKWQLLPKKEIVDQKKFMEFVDLKSDFYELGFEKIEPDYSFNQVSKKGNFKIFFDENEVDGSKIKVSVNLNYIIDKNNLQKLENSTLVIRNKNFFEINYLINKKGKYKLGIFGANLGKEKLDELCSVILISKKDSSSPLNYPKTYGIYGESDLQIIEPINGTLINGDKINLEFKSSTFNNLYIGIFNNGNNNFIEMEKHGNTFKEEEILIYGQKVVISTKNQGEKNYKSIIEYIVQINPDNKIEIIKYPKVFAGPKNRLIEPLCENLKRGKYFIFRIKSDFIQEMAVIIGETFHKLEKNDNIFYGKIKIEGEGNIVQIGYSEGNNSFGILYQYNIS